MMKSVKILICQIFVLAAYMAAAQSPVVHAGDTLHDGYGQSVLNHGHGVGISSAETAKPFDIHLSMGSSYIYNRSSSAVLYSVAPSVDFRPNDKLTVSASLLSVESFSTSSNAGSPRGGQPRSLAPYRNPRAVAMAAAVAASYKVSDRLWIGASYVHIGGELASSALVNPWYGDGRGVGLNATAFSAAARYRIGERSFVDFHVSILDDRAGTLVPLFFGAPYGGYGYFSATTFGGQFFDNPFFEQ